MNCSINNLAIVLEFDTGMTLNTFAAELAKWHTTWQPYTQTVKARGTGSACRILTLAVKVFIVLPLADTRMLGEILTKECV